MRREIVRDGIVAGILGATAVAIWFLCLDVFYSEAFATPAALGRALFRVFGEIGTESTLFLVGAYTIFHYAAFIGVGLLVSVIVHWAQTHPPVLAGAMILFVAFEIGFYGLSYALQASPLFGTLGWAQVGTGNIIAAITMGTYMWRTHPELRGELAYALSGQE